MASNFPSSLDTSSTIPAEAGTTALSVNHVIAHQNIQDILEAVEAKVGVDSSAVTTSHDYKLSAVGGSTKAVPNSGGSMSGATITTSTVNGVTLSAAGSSSQFLNGAGAYTSPTIADASATVKGAVEIATSAEITAGTAVGATGALLAVTPDQLAASTPVFNGSALTNLPSTVYYATASNNLKLSADTERSKATSGLTLIKSIRPSFGGIVRITHDMKGSSGLSSVESRIYVNGVAIGTSRTYTGTTYQSYSEDITINPGDQVQLYYAGDTGFAISCFVRNFRLSFDTTSAGNGYTITD